MKIYYAFLYFILLCLLKYNCLVLLQLNKLIYESSMHGFSILFIFCSLNFNQILQSIITFNTIFSILLPVTIVAKHIIILTATIATMHNFHSNHNIALFYIFSLGKHSNPLYIPGNHAIFIFLLP